MFVCFAGPLCLWHICFCCALFCWVPERFLEPRVLVYTSLYGCQVQLLPSVRGQVCDLSWGFILTWHNMTWHDMSGCKITILPSCDLKTWNVTWHGHGHDMTWTWHGHAWHGHDMTWFFLVFPDMTWHDMDMTWHGFLWISWHDTTWFFFGFPDMTWTWHDMACHVVALPHIYMLGLPTHFMTRAVIVDACPGCFDADSFATLVCQAWHLVICMLFYCVLHDVPDIYSRPTSSSLI